jgi:hypothetical protein
VFLAKKELQEHRVLMEKKDPKDRKVFLVKKE